MNNFFFMFLICPKVHFHYNFFLCKPYLEEPELYCVILISWVMKEFDEVGEAVWNEEMGSDS